MSSLNPQNYQKKPSKVAPVKNRGKLKPLPEHKQSGIKSPETLPVRVGQVRSISTVMGVPISF
jgi:hypothetical protein